MLIDHGSTVTAMDSEAIRLAAQNGHLEIVKMLYEEGAEYQVHQDYATRAAALLNHTKVVDYLRYAFREFFTCKRYAGYFVSDKFLKVLLF